MDVHPADPEDSALLAEHVGDAEGGTVLYEFRIGRFALTWHDPTGPLPELAPDIFETVEEAHRRILAAA